MASAKQSISKHLKVEFCLSYLGCVPSNYLRCLLDIAVNQDPNQSILETGILSYWLKKKIIIRQGELKERERKPRSDRRYGNPMEKEWAKQFRKAKACRKQDVANPEEL